ncbi:MAG: hypothetical protein PHU25_13620 [Deltaproteobacteria bacterium]|nr:hypothetical protein [Deltaproteobacteria bacterium]
MNKVVVLCLPVLALALAVAGCKGEKPAVQAVVQTPADSYKANLPPVPTIPKANVPDTYGDGSFSVYGLRHKLQKNLDQEVQVTAYIAKIYEKPPCADEGSCMAYIPHLFLADDPNETLGKRMIRLVTYAQNFQEMADEKEMFVTGEKREAMPDGLAPRVVVWDWQLGKKYKITARFVRQSGDGFMDGDGLLEYMKHQCLDCPPPETLMEQWKKEVEEAKKVAAKVGNKK